MHSSVPEEGKAQPVTEHLAWGHKPVNDLEPRQKEERDGERKKREMERENLRGRKKTRITKLTREREKAFNSSKQG